MLMLITFKAFGVILWDLPQSDWNDVQGLTDCMKERDYGEIIVGN